MSNTNFRAHIWQLQKSSHLCSHFSSSRQLLKFHCSPVGGRRLFSSSSTASSATVNWMPLKLFLLSSTALAFTYYYAFDSRAGMHRLISMPLVRALLDAEQSHTFTLTLAKHHLIPRDRRPDPQCLQTTLCGLSMSNPIGIAAGFDKHAEAIDGLYLMGFGMVEVGSVTPRPQPGNPKPRLFRLEADHAAINRFGFNSDGHAEVEGRLRSRMLRYLRVLGLCHSAMDAISPKSLHNGRVLGVNLGKNKISPATSNEDYIEGVRRLGQYADYIVVNVSSPNTPGLRNLQKKEILQKLMEDVKTARDQLEIEKKPPLLVKIAPDLSDEEVKDIAGIVKQVGINGVIIGNTTISRPSELISESQLIKETGGLSGKPLKQITLPLVKKFYNITNGTIPIIGCGGISSGQDALDYLEAGASALQLYTAIAYEGPGVVPEIKDYLHQVCIERNLNNISQLVGTKAKQ